MLGLRCVVTPWYLWAIAVQPLCGGRREFIVLGFVLGEDRLILRLMGAREHLDACWPQARCHLRGPRSLQGRVELEVQGRRRPRGSSLRRLGRGLHGTL